MLPFLDASPDAGYALFGDTDHPVMWILIFSNTANMDTALQSDNIIYLYIQLLPYTRTHPIVYKNPLSHMTQLLTA